MPSGLYPVSRTVEMVKTAEGVAGGGRREWFSLSGRAAVVIGGTSGLGRAIGLGLAEHGAEVVATGRSDEKVWETGRKIEEFSSRTIFQAVDVNRRESIDALRDAELAKFGRSDNLVNSAGDTNLNGVLRACQSFYPALKASGHGRIINGASLGSFLDGGYLASGVNS